MAKELGDELCSTLGGEAKVLHLPCGSHPRVARVNLNVSAKLAHGRAVAL